MLSSPIKYLIEKYNHFLVLLAVFFIYSNLAHYVLSKDIVGVSLLHWGGLFFVGSLGLLLFTKQWECLDNSYLKWAIGFFMVTMIYGWFSVGLWGWYPERGEEEILMNILTIIYLFSFCVILHRTSAFELARKLVLVILLISVVINIYDFVTMDKNQFCKIIGRAAGLYKDPNNCGIVMIFGFILSIGIVPKSFRMLFTSFVLVGIMLTQSRGAILVFLLVVLILMAQDEYSRKYIASFLVGLSLFGLVGISLLSEDSKSTVYRFTENASTILDRFENLQSSSSKSRDNRLIVFQHYVSLWADSPLIGMGLGAAQYNKMREGTNHFISSHNQFLDLMVDFGLIGFFLLISLLGALLSFSRRVLFSREGSLFTLVFLLFTFTSHMMLEHYAMLFCYAMFYRLFLYEFAEKKYQNTFQKLMYPNSIAFN